MGTRDDGIARIRRYIQENMHYFCAAPPEGMGWPRPGGLPKYYVDNPDEWQLDLQRVQDLKKAARRREAALGREDTTVSRGMEPQTKEALDSIRRMHQEGRNPAEIAEALDVREQAITQVLLMGNGVYDTSVPGPAFSPVVDAFTKNWGRNPPAGGHRNGNGNGHHKDSPL